MIFLCNNSILQTGRGVSQRTHVQKWPVRVSSWWWLQRPPQSSVWIRWHSVPKSLRASSNSVCYPRSHQGWPLQQLRHEMWVFEVPRAGWMVTSLIVHNTVESLKRDHHSFKTSFPETPFPSHCHVYGHGPPLVEYICCLGFTLGWSFFLHLLFCL